MSNTGGTAFTDLSITDNRFDNLGRGMYFYNTASSSISGNTISGATRYAIGLFGNNGTPANASLTIDNNVISNSGKGLYLESDTSAAAYSGSLTLTGNEFNTSGAQLSIYNDSASAIDATANDFNGVLASTASTVQQFVIVDAIVDAVDLPASGLVRTKAGEVFLTVNSFYVGPPYTQAGTSTASLQRAINAATAGDTIRVNSGTYTGDSSIDKNLTLLSETGAGSTTLTGVNTGFGGALSVATDVDNVTIGNTGKGFTINGTGDAALFLYGGNDNINVRANVINSGPRAAVETGPKQTNSLFSGNTFGGDAASPLVYIGGEASHGPPNASSNVDFVGNSFTGNRSGSPLLGQEASGSEISSNTFTGTSTYAGLELWGASATVTDNDLTTGGAGSAILVNGPASATIGGPNLADKNTITGWAVGIEVLGTADIQNDAISGASDSGIRVGGSSANAKIQDTTLVGNHVGIHVLNDAIVDAGSTTVPDGNPTGLGNSGGNNMLNGYTGVSGNFAIRDDNTVASLNRDVYARNNYFGNVVTISVIEGKIYDDTDNAANTEILFDAPLNSPPSAEDDVYVNDDWAGVPIGMDPDGAGPANLFGVDAFSVIQDGVNAVATNGAVHIYNGTYTENVSAPRAMHIDGLGVDSQAFTDPSVLLIPPADNTNTLTITASDVEVDGITIDNNGAFKARYGILATSTSPLTGISIHDNAVNDVLRRGIQLDSDFSAVGTITGNVITNVAGSDNGGESGIFVWAGEGVIVSGNTVNGSVSGITLQQGRGVTVTGNTITNTNIGVDVENSGGGGLSAADEIIANTVSGGTGADSIGIFVFNTNVDDVLDNNTISGVDLGVAVSNAGTAGATVSLTKNQLTATDTGVWVDTEDYGYGGFDIAVNIGDGTTGNANTISGSTSGVAVNSLYGRTATANLDKNTITASGTGIDVGAGSIASITNTNFDGVTDNGTDLSINPTAAVTIGNGNAFAGDTYYINNGSATNYNLVGNGTTFDLADNYDIEDRMYHKVDDLSKGLITWVANNVYVTDGGTDHSIQRGVDATAAAGDTVNVEAGAYVENVSVNKHVKVIGAGSGTGAGDTVVSKQNNTAIFTLTGSGASSSNPLLLQDIHVAASDVAGLYVPNATSISNIKLDNVSVVGTQLTTTSLAERGLWVADSADINGFVVEDSNFEKLTFGWIVEKQLDISGASNFDNVTVTNTNFVDNQAKGAYLEKLSHATFTDVDVVNNGLFTSFYIANSNAGFEVNLKGNVPTYEDLIFNNMTVTGNATAALQGQGLGIKARGTGNDTSYAATPATVSNVQVNGGTFSGNRNGIRVGEPGKANTSPTGVVIDGTTIENSVVNGVQVLGGNVTFTDNIITGNAAAGIIAIDGTASISGTDLDGTTDNATDIEINPTANVTIGSDNQFGGESFYINNGSATNYSLIPATGTTFDETGSDKNYRIEDKMFHKVDDGSKGLITWVTGNVYVTDGGTDHSIQRGVNAASAGNTVNVEAGSYTEDVSIDKSLSLLSDAGAGSTTLTGVNTGYGGALSVADGVDNVTIGNTGQGFTINGAGESALYLISNNDNTTVRANVINSAAGKTALLTGGQQTNSIISGNTFGGTGANPLVYVNGEASLGAANASSSVDFTGNIFTGTKTGPLLGLEASGSEVSGNTFSGSSSYAALELWGANTTVTGNTITGGGAGAGILVNAGVTGTVIDDSVADNTISGYAVGILVAGSATIEGNGATITGNTTGIEVTGTASIIDNSVTANGMGIDVNGGTALVQGNNLNSNTIGVKVRNAGVADLGQIAPTNNYTGVGISTGGNNFSSYTTTATSSAGAIVNLNTGAPYTAAGRQGPPRDVRAFGNTWAPLYTINDIENVVYHDSDNSAYGFVDFAAFSNLVAGPSSLAVNEGGSITVSGSFDNVPQAHTVTIVWGDFTPDTIIPLSSGTFSFTSPAHTYADDQNGPTNTTNRPVTITVKEDATANTLSVGPYNVAVSNVAPTVVVNGSAATINEGGAYSVTFGAVTDPGTDTPQSYAIDFGDGNFVTVDANSVPINGPGTYLSPVNYDGPQTYNICVRVVDEDGSFDTAGTTTVNVINLDPTTDGFIAASPSVVEGSSNTVIWLTPSDPSVNDAATLRFDYDINGDGDYNDVGIDIIGSSSPSAVVPGSQNLPGTHYVYSRMYDTDAPYTNPADPNDGYVLSSTSYTVTPATFRVTSVTANPSGFDIVFNHKYARKYLNIYGLDPSDVIVQQAGNTIPGSLVYTNDTTLTFVATGGTLSGSYSLLLKSGSATAFTDNLDNDELTGGGQLDGNSNGTAGDDYFNSSITVGSAGRVISIPDFARGPGQEIDLPANSPAQDGLIGMPLRLSDAKDVRGVQFTLNFDIATFHIKPADLALSTAASAAGWQVVPIPGVNLDGDGNILPGTIIIVNNPTTPTSLSTVTGPMDVLILHARVPDTMANYGKNRAIRFNNVILSIYNGVTTLPTAARGDVALHSVTYIGDTDRDAEYTPSDIANIASLAVLPGFYSFDRHPGTDPVIIADIENDLDVTVNDVNLMTNEVLLYLFNDASPEIPAIPPANLGNAPLARGATTVSMPSKASTQADGSVVLPLKILMDATERPALAFELAYDPAVQTFNEATGASLSQPARDAGLQYAVRLVKPGLVRVVVFSGGSVAKMNQTDLMTVTIGQVKSTRPVKLLSTTVSLNGGDYRRKTALPTQKTTIGLSKTIVDAGNIVKGGTVGAVTTISPSDETIGDGLFSDKPIRVIG